VKHQETNKNSKRSKELQQQTGKAGKTEHSQRDQDNRRIAGLALRRRRSRSRQSRGIDCCERRDVQDRKGGEVRMIHVRKGSRDRSGDVGDGAGGTQDPWADAGIACGIQGIQWRPESSGGILHANDESRLIARWNLDATNAVIFHRRRDVRAVASRAIWIDGQVCIKHVRGARDVHDVTSDGDGRHKEQASQKGETKQNSAHCQGNDSK